MKNWTGYKVMMMVNVRISNILFTYVDGTWAEGPGHRNVLNIRIKNIPFTYLGKNPGTTLDIKISNCWMVISNILFTYIDGTWAKGPGHRICAKYYD